MSISSNNSKRTSTLIFFDFETSGLDFEKDQIIEVGAIKVKNGKIVDSFNHLVRLENGRHLPSFISNLTGIKEEDLMKASPLEVVMESFLEFIEDGYLLAHNAFFDLGFLKKSIKKEIKNKIFDTLELARVFFPTLVSHSLSFLVEGLNLKQEKKHRALEDSLSLFRVFKKIKEKSSSLDGNTKKGILNLYKETRELGLLDYEESLFEELENKIEEEKVFEEKLKKKEFEREKVFELLKDIQFNEDLDQVYKMINYDLENNKISLCEYRKDIIPLILKMINENSRLNKKIVIIVPDLSLKNYKKELELKLKNLNIQYEIPILRRKKDYICIDSFNNLIKDSFYKEKYSADAASLYLYLKEARNIVIEDFPNFLKKSPMLEFVNANFCDNECKIKNQCPFIKEIEEKKPFNSHFLLYIAPLSFLFDDIEKNYGENFNFIFIDSQKAIQPLIENLDIQISLKIFETAKEAILAKNVQEKEKKAEIIDGITNLFYEIYKSRVNLKEEKKIQNRVILIPDLSSTTFVYLLKENIKLFLNFENLDLKNERILKNNIFLLQEAFSKFLLEKEIFLFYIEEQASKNLIFIGKKLSIKDYLNKIRESKIVFIGTSIAPLSDFSFFKNLFEFKKESLGEHIFTKETIFDIPTIIPMSLPQPNEDNFEEEVAKFIRILSLHLEGNSIVISNSHETLKRISTFLEKKQGPGLKQEFLKNNGYNKDLFYPEEEKRLYFSVFDSLNIKEYIKIDYAFFTKLPFPNLNLPFIRFFKEKLKAQKLDPFKNFDLPYALILFKDSLSKLLEKKSIKAIFFLDKRSITANYSDKLIKSFPHPFLYFQFERLETLLDKLPKLIKK